MESDIDELSLAEKLFGLPLTRPGWWAVWLALAFTGLFAAAVAWGERAGNPHPGFWRDPLSAFLVIVTAACGVASGGAAATAILRRERSLFVFGTLLLGLVVLLYIVAELSGA